MFSSLEYFVGYEYLYDDKIGDKQEGKAFFESGTIVADPSRYDYDEQRAMAAEYGVVMDAGASVTVSDNHIVQTHPNGLIFCFSCGDLEALSLEFGRDAHLEISDPHWLASVINETGRAAALGNILVRDAFDVLVGKVEYEERYMPRGSRVTSSASPFKKLPKYQSQSEWRIFLWPRDGVECPDRTLIRFSPPAGLLQFEGRVPQATLPPNEPINWSDVIVEIDSLYRACIAEMTTSEAMFRELHDSLLRGEISPQQWIAERNSERSPFMEDNSEILNRLYWKMRVRGVDNKEAGIYFPFDRKSPLNFAHQFLTRIYKTFLPYTREPGGWLRKDIPLPTIVGNPIQR